MAKTTALQTQSGIEYLFLDEQGRIQSVDIHTGETRILESSITDINDYLDVDKFTKVKTKTGEIAYVPNRITASDFESLTGERKAYPYSPLLADQICTLVAEGKTLTHISKLNGMPSYSVMARWRIKHPEFDEMYKQARKDRAEVYFTKILDEVENARADRDEIALARLKTDIYKFAAKVCAPDEYMEKTQVDARVAVGTFTIETGIRRETDPGFNKDETKLITESALGETPQTPDSQGMADSDE